APNVRNCTHAAPSSMEAALPVNAGQPSPSAQFSAFLSRLPDETVALAKRCISKLRRTFSGAPEIVYDYSDSLVVSFSLSGRGDEGIVTVDIRPQRVQLYFDKSLPDPNRRLKGSGTK